MPDCDKPTGPLAVVLPCFNAAPFVECAINSILDEAADNWQIIVVDDGSTDQTGTVLKRFGDRVRVIAIGNGGPSRARNVGLAACTTERVVFLDADDYVEAGYLTALAQVGHDSGADLTIGAYKVKSSSKGYSDACRLSLTEDARKLLLEVLSGNFPQTACVGWRTQYLREIGAWREDLRLGEDVELLLRALLKTPRITHSTDGHVVYRNHETTTRLTRNVTIVELRSQFEFSEDLLRDVPPEDVRVRSLFGRQYYTLASRAYSFSDAPLGDHYLRRARELGYHDHAGNQVHSALASALGLRRKTWLVDRWRDYRPLFSVGRHRVPGQK